VIDLRDANPVPRDRIQGWAQSAEGRATRARVEPRRSVEPQRGARPVRTIAVAAALVLALVALVVALRVGGDGRTPTAARSVIDRLARGQWQQLDAGPAADLDPVVSTIWTGRELLVWGSSRTSAKAEGFAFEPRRGRWRTIAPSPVIANPAVWTGRELLVWSGQGMGSASCPCAGAAYDPKADSWRSIPQAPFAPLGPTPGATATWTGRDLVVTNGYVDRCLSVTASSCYPDVASYDPASDSWEILPDPPVSLRGNESIRATWTGREVVYVVPSGNLAARAAMAFDPELRTWRRLEAPFPTRIYAAVGLVRDGRTAASIQWNTDDLEWIRLTADGRWDPGALKLRHPFICDVEASPVPRGAVVFCDRGHLVGLDLTNGAWHRFPVAPSFLPRWVTWTGHELLAFTDQQLLALEPAAK
jgi:hypothetical protein